MKTETTAARARLEGCWPARPGWGAALLLALALPVAAQVQVTTLGGGPRVIGGSSAGYWDGAPVQDSQFNFPVGLAFDPRGKLLVADRENGRLRSLDFTVNQVFTVEAGLSQPVGVAVDGATNIYVLNQGDGSIFKYDVFGNRVAPTINGLVKPTAFALDSATNLYVTELGGAVKRVSRAGVVTTVGGGFNQPQGIAVMDSGLLAVSDTGNHVIQLLNPTNGVLSVLTGGNGPGFVDGFKVQSRLNLPHGLAKAPNGSLVVADRGNHRVRVVTTNGTITTLYGTNSANWFSDYPGWEDGAARFAEGREPVGVTVARDGAVYVSEDFYHLIRGVTGAGGLTGTGSGTGDGGNTVVVKPPEISPVSGFYPMGQAVTVTSESARVFFTTDGTEPTTNSRPVTIGGDGTGTLLWQETLRDLTSLRLKAFDDSTNGSTLASGKSSTVSQIGITRDVTAGIGSTVLIPVTIDLRSEDRVRSLQFRVEITPNGDAPPVSDQFRAVGVSTNDFVPVATSSSEASGPGIFNSSRYQLGDTRGLAIAYISTVGNILIRDFGAVAMLAVPVPPTAREGDEYTLRLLAVTGTSDAQQTAINLTVMPATKIQVRRVSYLVGDSSVSHWYNAELLGEQGPGAFGFGDGRLQNNDVNNAFSASFGLNTPYPFSDLFNAMDTYPEDAPGSPGGDGQIRYLDWQVILARSLGLDQNNWRRVVSPGGIRVPVPTTLSIGNSTRSIGAAGAGGWRPAVKVRAGVVTQAGPGTVVAVPVEVEVEVSAGRSLSGMQFRAVVTAEGGSPALTAPVQFVAAEGLPQPLPLEGLPGNQVGCAWSLYANPFTPALTGTTRLGVIRVTIPAFARSSDHYTVRFANADGSPVPVESYEFETVPGAVWVASGALTGVEVISDEWKVAYFGSHSAAAAQAGADPDGDGLSNGGEYAAGTDPTAAGSRLALEIQRGSSGVTLSWLTVSGRNYLVEGSGDLGQWVAVGGVVSGTGGLVEVAAPAGSGTARYYRVRLAP